MILKARENEQTKERVESQKKRWEKRESGRRKESESVTDVLSI